MAIRKAYVDLTDGQMHYRYSVAPKGGLPLVFLHQTASSSAMYQAVMEKLDGLVTMYAFDTPGFGGSFRPPKKPDVAYYVGAIIEAMKALNISRCHLFGHHTGAAIACQLAADFPAHVEKLGMIGPVQLTQADRDLWQKTAIHPMSYSALGDHLQWTWQRVTNLDSQPIQYPP
jgi:pimeloyl-ACP methyl ester carboxylesterase